MAATASFLSSKAIMSQIRSRILFSGPIPVADYMRMALTQSSGDDVSRKNQDSDSDQGYYMKKDMFGKEGDFTTSPEITQMFGELVSIWGMQTWKQLRGPNKFNVVELGPGRGTLSADMLRVFRQFESVIGKDIALNLVEVSPYLSKVQHGNLCIPKNETKSTEEKTPTGAYLNGKAKISHYPISWYKDLRDVPKEFSLYIAHEFFDALPIHKLQKVDNEWREVLVDVKEETNDGFRFVISRHETPALQVIKARYPTFLESTRQHLEISLDALIILEELTLRLKENGGIAVIVDYGHDGTKEDTFRAFYKHQLHDPLVTPGIADLTADVDFSIFKKGFSESALLCGPVSQQDFLRRIGIDVRLQSLLQSANESEKKQLQSGYEMIMNDMGTRFHFFGLFPKVLEQFLPKLKIAGFHD